MPLEIYLLSSIDKLQEKREKLHVNLREKRAHDLISQVNLMSRRQFYTYDKLDDKIQVYSVEKKELMDLGVVDKIVLAGHSIDWIEKIIPTLRDSGIIAKTKSYVEPQEIERFEKIIKQLRSEIGEGEVKEIEDFRYGKKVLVREGAWSGFWDWMEYLLDISRKCELYMLIPTFATFA
jgi:hypothetical protein